MSSPFQDRLFRGYGPLVGFTAVFLAVVILVPSRAPESVDASGGKGQSISDLLGDTGEEEAADDTVVDSTASTDTTVPIDPATGEPVDGSSSGGGTAGTAGKSGKKAGAAGTGAAGAAADPKAPAKLASCGAAQIPNDPYSPPCVQWSGGNGGDTTKGVTATEITVTVRIDSFANGMLDAVASSAGAGKNLPKETPERIQRTIEGLVEYFNKRFQFYGRKLKLVVYDGKGDVLYETLGQGQEGAQADALKVAQEYQAFADISAVTAPYADALASKGVINIGVPYVPRAWLNARKPFSWTQFTDGSTVAESASSYYATKMAGQPAANAGAPVAGQPRKLAVVAPSNEIYQQSVTDGINMLRQAGGGEPVLNEAYKLQVDSQVDANSIANKITTNGITTVMCACDPIFLKFLTGALASSNYRPEFIMVGVALADNDLVGQLMEQSVWKHAFGVSFAGPTQKKGTALGYRAYKSTRPDEPSLGVELIYNQLYLLAIGIQMAGPQLTVPSFEKGMYDYPRKSGPVGTWGFAPGDYSTSDDAREVYWNPSAQSVETLTQGAYIDSNGGARFPTGKWPGGNPKWSGGQ
jgi:hypothetical protein